MSFLLQAQHIQIQEEGTQILITEWEWFGHQLFIVQRTCVMKCIVLAILVKIQSVIGLIYNKLPHVPIC